MEETVIQSGGAQQSSRIQALKQAMSDHGNYLLHYLHRHTQNYQDAENLAQALWIHVYGKFEEEKIGHLPWLRRKAWQLFVDHYRRRRFREQTPIEEVEIPDAGFFREAENESEEIALQARFWENFADVEISERDKETLWRYERYGYTLQELADYFECGLSTIRDRLNSTKQRMADCLNRQEKALEDTLHG